jgi:hypothetical protein
MRLLLGDDTEDMEGIEDNEERLLFGKVACSGSFVPIDLFINVNTRRNIHIYRGH